MDSNKGEAERCVQLAECYFAENKYEEAEKFLRKARKIYPPIKVDDLLSKISNLAKSSQTQQNAEPELRKRTASSNKENLRSQAPSDYTREQFESVKRVKKCKTYYEMLGVTKEATDSEIKKSYKKLALQLHPDKNKAPGAAEAFKIVGNAVAVLIDVEKRKQYDMYGCDEERMQAHSRHNEAGHYEYGRRFEADITAEELFNMFFGGGFPQQEFFVRRSGNRWSRQNETQSQHNHSQQAHGYTSFLQMLPVLLLIVLTMMSSFFISDPVYSLHQSTKYSIPRTTQNLKIPYYVKENFHSEYQGSLRRLEASVEEEYMNYHRHNCIREKHYRESMIMKARTIGNQEMYNSAKNIEMPSCRRLQEVYAN